MRGLRAKALRRLQFLLFHAHARVPCMHLLRSFESGFELICGDISTVPQTETVELKSLTSGKVLGIVSIHPKKNAWLEERIMFKNTWFVGAEHGLVHDGLQADGSIELRMDWKVEAKAAAPELVGRTGRIRHGTAAESDDRTEFAILRVNPWLAYGCGEGARLTLRKPGASDGTASTVQRILRDDLVVVRRDGTDSELTVDPTPFSVVLAPNIRHRTGTRLLLVHDNASTDAVVEPWPGNQIDYTDGSRHALAVQGRSLSGWVTMATKDGVANLRRVDKVSRRTHPH